MLDISLTTTSGLSTKGYPRIDVTRADGKTRVKDVDKTDGGDLTAIFTIDDTPTHLGIYLPSGTEGDVVVSAEIVAAMGACDLTCAPKTVSVHGGDVTSVALMLTGDAQACAATKADGGTDATVDLRADVNETDAADASEGGTATVDDCMAYCALYLADCPNNADAPSFNCFSKCETASWPVGSANDVTGQNTLSCRLRHLRAGANPPLDCSECSGGSPDSPGVCGPTIDAGARDACPLYPS